MGMATQRDLFLAVLALDAYNRGYGPGMNFSGDSSLAGTQIGDATILAATNDDLSKAASFYAIAYSWDDDVIISYRGTRFPGAPDKGDVLNGWSLSSGFGGASQAQMALKFYTQVQAQFAGGVGGQDITLTGHSLGGGLAGFVSDLTGAKSDVFNNIPFGTGVVAQIVSHDRSQGLLFPAFALLGYDPIFGGNYEKVPSSSAAVRQFITAGEVATGLRATTGQLSFAKFMSQFVSPTDFIDPATAAALAAAGVRLDLIANSQTLDSNFGLASPPAARRRCPCDLPGRRSDRKAAAAIARSGGRCQPHLDDCGRNAGKFLRR
jgi:hypothetical protein